MTASWKYRNGLLVAGENAAESLQVSLLLSEGQLQPSPLTLQLLHTVVLFIYGPLQAAQGVLEQSTEFSSPDSYCFLDKWIQINYKREVTAPLRLLSECSLSAFFTSRALSLSLMRALNFSSRASRGLELLVDSKISAYSYKECERSKVIKQLHA